jgi:chromatin segregation and condensation protein Rec8/ScpA/Scc1 (kleisin family)
MTARGEVIATFLAILELVRQRTVLILQRLAFDDILLAPPTPEEPAP